MGLEDFITKGGIHRLATAIPATPATDEGEKAGNVASVATVAVANAPRDEMKTGASVTTVANVAVARDRGAKLKPATVGSPAPCPVDLAERAAILEYDGGVERDVAEQMAALEHGHSDYGSAGSDIVAGWRNNLAALASQTHDRQQMELLASLMAFCDEWGVVAAAKGWDAVALFGVDPNVPHPDRQRRDRHGLFISLTKSVHQSEIIEMTRDKAILKTQTGAKHVVQRFHSARDNAAPLWEVVDLL